MTSYFDETDIAAWTAQLEKSPRPIDEAEVRGLPEIQAIDTIATPDGIAVRFRGKHGDEPTFFMNPVFARHVLSRILRCGQAAGWLNDDADVVCQPRPPDQVG